MTIASCFIFNPRGELLLLRRHRDDFGGGLWVAPAGRVEPEEDAEAAVLREVLEETGINLLSVEHLGLHEVTMPHGSNRIVSFRAATEHSGPILLRPDEHEDYAWFSLPGLLTERDIIWATPTILYDFGLLPHFETDPTLADGSIVVRLF